MADETNAPVIVENVEDTIQLLSDELLSNALGKDEQSKANRRYLFDKVDPDLFKNENYLIYNALYIVRNKGVDGSGLSINLEYLNLHLFHNRKMIMEAEKRKHIDLSMVVEGSDDKYLAYIGNVLTQFEYLCIPEEEVEDSNDYAIAVESFLLECATLQMRTALSQSKEILLDSRQDGRKTVAGYDDAANHIRQAINKIDILVHPDEGEGFVDAKDIDIFNGTVKPTKLADFDLIPTLNSEEYIGGIYSDMFYNIMAPTKGGKSKFTARMAHAVLLNGHNATIWPYEGGKEAWLAQIYVIHAEYLARKEGIALSGSTMNQKTVLYDSWTKETENLKHRVLMAKEDLINSGKYGNINFIEKPLVVETFIENLVNGIKLNNNARFVLVDYLQLIGSENKTASKPQYIGKAYQAALAFAKKYHCCFVSPSQFKQEFMTEMAMSKDGDSHELRSAGGESAEIVRTPDYNIALYASPTMMFQQQMKLLSIPSRMSSQFPEINLHTDLGTCRFQEV